jgi:hypothetical protein
VSQSIYNGITAIKHDPDVMRGILASAREKVQDNPKAVELVQAMYQALGDFTMRASQEQRGFANPDLARYHQKIT